MLWSLAAVLVVGFLASWLDVPAAEAQEGEDTKVEVGDDLEIQDDPHLYWKCWRTDSGSGSGGFTSRDITSWDFFGLAPYSAFATPELPVLDDQRLDTRGHRLIEVGQRNGARWKISRGDLIDGRFYRPTDLVRVGGAASPTAASVAAYPVSAQDALFAPNENAGIAGWNPFLPSSDARIESLRVEWNTGAGRSGQAAADDVDRLQQEQAGGAEITEQSANRAVPYRGDSEAFGGQLDTYAAINEDRELSGLNFHGGRNHYGTVSSQVVAISGTVTTVGSGPNVTTTVTLDSTPQDVTNQQVSAETNDPVNPEIFVSTVSKAEDHPRLLVVASTGYHDDGAVSNAFASLYHGLEPPSGFKVATSDNTRNAPAVLWKYPVDACFHVRHVEDIRDSAALGAREYRLLCWMVRSTSVESAVTPAPTQTLVATAADIGGTDFRLLNASDLSALGYSGVVPWSLNADGNLEIPNFPVWVESGLEETSDALYHEAASRRRDTLAPPEVDDSPDDEILVGINLKAEYRGDPETDFTFTDDSGDESRMWKMFGDETVGRRIIRDGSDWHYAGYQQSYMLPFFWGGDGVDDPDHPDAADPAPPHPPNDPELPHERVVPWMYDHNDPLMRHFGMESLVLWPVHLQDMNYYLFNVRDFTKEHAGDRGHVLNLAYAGYSGLDNQLGMVEASVAPFIAITYNLIRAYRGVTGDAVPVPPDAKGTSGRTNVLLTDLQLKPFTPGKLYYPFYDAQEYDRMVAGGHANYAFDDKRDLLLHPEHLVKAGVVAPDDAGNGPGSFGGNSVFQWTIREGVPVAGLGGGNREEVYRRHGFDPTYLDHLASGNSGASDPFVQYADSYGIPRYAWPNGYISPDDTHLLVLTFYEGRLAHRWKFVPAFVEDGLAADLYKAVGEDFDEYVENLADGAGTVLSWFGASAGDAVSQVELIPDLGAVPTFQFRRVICRVVVPPEGVVTPATGITAVVEKLQDVQKGLISGFLGAINKLISFVEKIPGHLMVGMANTAAEGVCHGGKLLGDVGGGENDLGRRESVSPGIGADLEINNLEHRDRVAQDECEGVRENGIDDIGPECDAVAAAVGDPACSSVPAIDFGRYDGLLGYKIDWPDPLPSYRDVWYYSYPGEDSPSADLAFAEGFSLQDSIDVDRGLPELTFRLPYGSSQAGVPDTIINVGAAGPPDPHAFTIDQALQIAGSADYDGYVLYVKPDRRTFRFVDCDEWESLDPDNSCDPGGFPRVRNVPQTPAPLAYQDTYRFFLPRYYIRYSSLDEVRIGAVEEFKLGSVPLQRGPARPGCGERSVQIKDGASSFSCDTTPGNQHQFDIGSGDNVTFLGYSEWERLSAYLDYMWYLGSGAEISLAISAYRGDTQGDSWTEGPISDWVHIKGGPGLACLQKETYWVTYWAEEAEYYSGLPDPGYDGVRIFGSATYSATETPDPSAYVAAKERSDLYNCEAALGPSGDFSHFGEGSDYYLDQRQQYLTARDKADRTFCVANTTSWRCDPRLQPDSGPLRGVIAAQGVPDLATIYNSGYLFGSSVCGGVWAGTPSGLSWDSEIVHTVWSICWVFAIVLLFALLLWDGLSLTYSGWVGDGRGAATVSSMIPRFTVALLLASASLFICRIVLTLSADVTCFFVHATGTTMWTFIAGVGLGIIGAIGTIFGVFFLKSAVLTVVTGGTWMMIGVIVLVGLAIILMIFLFFFGYYLLKVFGGMLVRMFLLMVLMGLGPVAFAFYASPSTEHWTKRWVSLLLGTAFQQIVVLVVLFVGASLVDSIIASFQESDIWGIFMGLLGALLIVFLAAKVPDLVNPGARGMFAGFAQALGMAAAAGAVIGGGLIGAGAIAGGSAGGAAGGALRGAAGRIGDMFNRGSSVSPQARGQAAQAMAEGGGSPVPDIERPVPVSSGDVPISGSQATQAPGVTGLSGSDIGGAAPAQSGGFFNRLGRGFMGGASRGGMVGRSMYNLQTGRSFIMGDASTDYSGNSLAQLQSFRNYVNNADPESDSALQDRVRRVRQARGGVREFNRSAYRPDVGNEVPDEGIGHTEE